MSLQNFINADQTSVMENAEVLEHVSEDSVAGVLTVAMEAECSEEELDEVEESYQSGGVSAVTEGTEYGAVLERSIVKLDKKAKKQQAYKMAILQVEKEKGTKEYKQWCFIKKAEKVLMMKMEKRSAMKAKALMREAAKEAKKSPKKAFVKAGNHLTRSEKRTKEAMSGNHVMSSALKSNTNSIINKFKSKIG